MPLPWFLWGEESLFNRLFSRFKLTEIPGKQDAYPVIRTIQPVTLADDLLKLIEITTHTVSITGNVTVTIATIPADERWQIHSIWYAQMTGTFQVTSFSIYDGTTLLPIYAPSAGSSQQKFFEKPMPLDRNWQIQITTSGYSVTGNAVLRMLVEKEKAY